jgi:hypothetical protein
MNAEVAAVKTEFLVEEIGDDCTTKMTVSRLVAAVLLQTFQTNFTL